MRIVMADEFGFCYGVRRAVEIMEKAAKERGRIETIGAVVHNHRVVETLKALNVDVVNSPDEAKGRLVAITAHGAPPNLYDAAKDRGLEVFDTTCPSVKKAQKAAKALAEAGFDVYVFGDPEHPEVRGILGWAGTRAAAGRDWREVRTVLTPRKKVGLLSQTTQAPEHFAAFVKEVLDSGIERFAEVRVVNTICRGTVGRQSAVKKLAQEVDLVLVVGSRTSANTKHLAELSAKMGAETHLVEDAGQIRPEWLVGRESVGITAGASTPDALVSEVIDRVTTLGASQR